MTTSTRSSESAHLGRVRRNPGLLGDALRDFESLSLDRFADETRAYL